MLRMLLMSRNSNVLRVAVVGLGVMGQNHLRALASMKSIEITAVVDVNVEQAEKTAALCHCQAFSFYDSLPGLVDAAIVAAPSIYHREIGEFLLLNNIDCLIEKPLATTEEDCLALIKAAEASGRTLMVGHIERFNPAVQKLRDFLNEDIKIFAFESRRMSPVGKRITDVDVVSDLMIHDIDIICSMTNAKVLTTQGNASLAKELQKGDYVNAHLSFDDGSVASLAASRITHHKVRELLLTTDQGTFTLNFLSQELHFHRKDLSSHLSKISPALDYSTERFFVRHAEPLPLELHHFFDAVRNKKKPLIDGRDALNALQVVWDIQSKL